MKKLKSAWEPTISRWQLYKRNPGAAAAPAIINNFIIVFISKIANWNFSVIICWSIKKYSELIDRTIETEINDL